VNSGALAVALGSAVPPGGTALLRLGLVLLLSLVPAVSAVEAGEDGSRLVTETWARYRGVKTEREEIELLIVSEPQAQLFSRAEAEGLLAASGSGVTHKRAVRHALYAADWSDKVHILFSLPAEDAGLGFLAWRQADAAQDSMWIFMPGYRSVRRVPLSSDQKLAGTDLNYEDVRELAGERTTYFSYQTLGSDTIDGRTAEVITATPKPESGSVYARRKLWIDEEWQFPLQVEYYDGDNHLWKVLHNSDIVEVAAGVRRAGLTEIRDLSRHESTLLLITKRELGIPIAAQVFTQDYLQHPGSD
jgi:hypothetical protein